MKIKYLPVALLLCVSLAGCSLALPEEEDSGSSAEPPAQQTFTDMSAGLMVSLYRRGEEWFERVTSQTIDEENCVAVWGDVSVGDVTVFSGECSGGGYLFQRSSDKIGTTETDGGAAMTATMDYDVYVNAALVTEEGECAFSFDTLTRDGSGEIVVEEQGVLYVMSYIGGSASAKSETKQEIRRSETLDGETKETVDTLTLTVTVTLNFRAVGSKWRILQYDRNGELLAATPVYEDGEGTFALAEGCDFLVGEETVGEETVRTLYQKEDGKFPRVEFFCDGGFGFLTKAFFAVSDPDGE